MTQHVFRDSGEPPYMEFVGDFEAKYRSEEDPWEQSGATGQRSEYYEFSRPKLYARLHNRIPKGARGCEIGCGFGHVTKMLARRYDMVGVDVSETALKKAEHFNPGLNLRRADITSENFLEVFESWDIPRFHFLILGQCWWYLLHKLDLVLDNALGLLMSDGYLVLSQAFLKEQNYGREIADGFEGAVNIFIKHPRMRLLEASQEDSGELCYYDGLIIARKVA